jgi:hypothetical protein
MAMSGWAGIAALAWAAGKAPGPSHRPMKQLVLFAVALHADKSGVTWVGRRTLAANSCMGTRTISRYLADLERAGVIARVRRHDERGNRAADYIVLAPFDQDRGGMHPVAEHWPDVAAKLTDPRCQQVHLGGEKFLGAKSESLGAKNGSPRCQQWQGEEVEEEEKTSPPASYRLRKREGAQQQQDDDDAEKHQDDKRHQAGGGGEHAVDNGEDVASVKSWADVRLAIRGHGPGRLRKFHVDPGQGGRP